jgi:hypothetical protein
VAKIRVMLGKGRSSGGVVEERALSVRAYDVNFDCVNGEVKTVNGDVRDMRNMS